MSATSSDASTPPKAPAGLTRLLSAWRNSLTGFRHAIKSEAAVREELIGLIILVPVSILLPVTRVEHLLLVLVLLLVLLVEMVNTAIEATVDRISLDRHPLAGLAKDLGSAAVLLSILMMLLTWVVIVFPVALHWWRQ